MRGRRWRRDGGVTLATAAPLPPRRPPAAARRRPPLPRAGDSTPAKQQQLPDRLFHTTEPSANVTISNVNNNYITVIIIIITIIRARMTGCSGDR
ncbi:hypothetical protein E2C01_015587 [Portunus trituberculatus]|uniref:Uncharacterized protein n=1 Tax=Portunus trituberculatus TaxID=210409 RepID=A0A5B7DM34_PORTR|nr:hypothetical protein [Portunus trituberculatus]